MGLKLSRAHRGHQTAASEEPVGGWCKSMYGFSVFREWGWHVCWHFNEWKCVRELRCVCAGCFCHLEKNNSSKIKIVPSFIRYHVVLNQIYFSKMFVWRKLPLLNVIPAIQWAVNHCDQIHEVSKVVYMHFLIELNHLSCKCFSYENVCSKYTTKVSLVVCSERNVMWCLFHPSDFQDCSSTTQN